MSVWPGALVTLSAVTIGRAATKNKTKQNKKLNSDGIGCHARCRSALQEQFGVQYIAQGHFDKPGESNQRPFDKKTLTLPLNHGWQIQL